MVKSGTQIVLFFYGLSDRLLLYARGSAVDSVARVCGVCVYPSAAGATGYLGFDSTAHSF